MAPWMTTVGATAMDQLFSANLMLGNEEVLIGQSLYTKKAKRTGMAPLVWLRSCDGEGDFSPNVVMGKIVMCLNFVGAYESILVQNASGTEIVAVDGVEWHADEVSAMPFTLSVLTLGSSKSMKLRAYMSSVANLVALFSFACGTITSETQTPTVVGFSSRGPNQIIPKLLKPDVVVSGLNILAAWPNNVPLSIIDMDTRRSEYNILSRTSMACPHTVGVAMLIKKKHGNWTPAMVRSVMMMTAGMLDNNSRDIFDESVQRAGTNFTSVNPLAVGAVHICPQLAMDPGLVYDADVQDYVDFLYSLNYTTKQLRVFTPDLAGCRRKLLGGPANLNYPSFVVVFDGHTRIRKLTWTVMKVYEEPETYNMTVAAAAGVKVTVKPTTLEFKEKNEMRSYTVEFRSKAGGHVAAQDFGQISWENRKHRVRSHVVFTWKD
ncbi:hypothetical protein ABZP36_001350 [Zizania latifolia]